MLSVDLPFGCNTIGFSIQTSSDRKCQTIHYDKVGYLMDVSVLLINDYIGNPKAVESFTHLLASSAASMIPVCNTTNDAYISKLLSCSDLIGLAAKVKSMIWSDHINLGIEKVCYESTQRSVSICDTGNPRLRHRGTKVAFCYYLQRFECYQHHHFCTLCNLRKVK